MGMFKGFRVLQGDLKGESGRTMIEMLATLAIVGVLSITALWGYHYAIELHKENETVDWVVKSIVGSRTGFITDKYGERAEAEGSIQIPIKEVISGVTFLEPEADGTIYGFTTPTGAEISVDVINKKTFEVYVDEMTWNVCRKLLRANLEYTSAKLSNSNQFVYTTSTDDEISAFCEIVDPAKRSPSRPNAENPEGTEGLSFILCFGTDCQGGCRSGTILCPSDLKCCDDCDDAGFCDNTDGTDGCPVTTPYVCEDDCCKEDCPYTVKGQAGSYCSCPDGTYDCEGVCIPDGESCGGCPTDRPYECVDGCCKEDCPYTVKGQSGSYCSCPIGTYDCEGICIPNSESCDDGNDGDAGDGGNSGSEGNEPGSPVHVDCATDADCPTEQPYCVQSMCVECRVSADCPEGACVNHSCGEGCTVPVVREERDAYGCRIVTFGCADEWARDAMGIVDICVVSGAGCSCLETEPMEAVFEVEPGVYWQPDGNMWRLVK